MLSVGVAMVSRAIQIWYRIPAAVFSARTGRRNFPGVTDCDAVTVSVGLTSYPGERSAGLNEKSIVVPPGAAGRSVSRSRHPDATVAGSGQSDLSVTGPPNWPSDVTVIIVDWLSPPTTKNGSASSSASLLAGGQPCCDVSAMPPPITDCWTPVLEYRTTRPLRMSA